MITSKIKKKISLSNISYKRRPNQCKRIRNWLYSSLSKHINPEAGWLQDHIANCPRCRKRFISCSKVNLALSFIRSQPQNLGLLKHANEQAIGVLRHSLREAPRACVLKKIQPEPKLLTAESVNFFLKSSTDEKFFSIAAARVPVGAPPPFGDRPFQ